MILVTIEMDMTASSDAGRVLEVTNWIAATLNEKLPPGTKVHSIRVEEE